MQGMGRLLGVRFFLSAFLCLVLRLSASAQPDAQSDILVSGHYPPMMIEDSEVGPGFSNDLVLEAARRLGRDVDLRFMSFNRCMEELRSQANTIQGSIIRNTAREAEFRWLVHTHDEEFVFLSVGHRTFDGLEEGRTLQRIAVERGSAVDNFLTARGFTNLVRVPDPRNSAKLLAEGRVDAWGMAKSQSRWVWDHQKYDLPLRSGKAFASEPVYVAVGFNFPEDEAKAYKKTIKQILEDGTFDRLRARYLPD